MRKPWAVFVIAVTSAIRAVPCEAQTNEIAFTHVAVVDVQSGKISPDMTVLISGQKIREVGSSRVVHVPKQAHSADARGKYLIPGLWDMHVHSLWDAERPARFFPLFLANGVTGVREMGGPMPAADQVRWRDQVASGVVIGPRLVVPGPFVDGPHSVWPGSINVVTAGDGKKAVDSLKSARADFLKVYTGVSRAAYFGVAEEAKKGNFAFVGHVPLEVDVAEASNAGQRSVEHLMGILLYSSSQSDELLADLRKGMNSNLLNNQMVDTYDPTKASTLFALFVKNATWQVPTLTIRYARPYLKELQASNDARLNYIPKSIAGDWGPKVDARQPTDPWIIASRKHLFQKEMEVVGSMHHAGVKLMAGTDTPNPYCFPGFSLHDELGFMVQAGLTPLEALQTATMNPVKFLGLTKTLGTVEKGKIADLVLLDANPLESIANTKRITAVVSAGRLFDREALDGLLAGVASNVASAATH
jgi:imidazolonepropionase-like amidohydrolase